MATTGAKTYRNYIGGEWVDATSGDTFESTNPATGDLIGVFPKSTVEDTDRAVEAAKAAYDSWRLVPAPKRAEILFRVAQTWPTTWPVRGAACSARRHRRRCRTSFR
jgi:acyl-CoA reductase-like NAD-dependent aldehyde dehydrogenase